MADERSQRIGRQPSPPSDAPRSTVDTQLLDVWTDLLSQPVLRTCLITLAVFVFDMLTPLGIAASALYMAAVLSAVSIPRRRAVLVTALTSSALVLVGWWLSAGRGHTEVWKVVVNRGISLGVVWGAALTADAWIRVQRAQAKQMQENQLLHQAMSLSAMTSSFEEALANCIRMICDIMHWPIGHAYHYDAETRKLVSSSIWTMRHPEKYPRFRDVSASMSFASGEGVPGQIWERGKPTWFDTLSDPRFDLLGGEPLPLEGAFGFPVFVDGELQAVVEFFSPAPAAPNDQMLLLAGSLGGQLGRLAERRRRNEERAWTAAIVESSYDAIISKDLDGRIISWNEGAERVYGYSEDEALGQPITIILPEGVDAEEAEIADALRRGRRLVQFEARRRRKNGALIDVALTVSPILDSRERVVGSSTIERNISLRKERERQLQEAKRAAEDANRTKSEFLANVSHELRTPMNAVLGMLDLALSENLSEVTRDFLGTARESAQDLLLLLNDLLDFSRMEFGRFELEPAPFRLRDTLDAAVRGLSLRASEKGLELACHVERQVPVRLLGDGLRLRQVVMNLAGNAVKFTEQGEVVVSVTEAERYGDRVKLQFAVRDTGIGIAPEDQERIFAPFTQADASTTRKQPGTGLGLAICQELIAKMGGRTWLESEPGVGSTFYCTAWFDVLPDEPDDTADVQELRNLPVLVVDDNPTNLRILNETLSDWSMRPRLAENGQAALEEFRRSREDGGGFALVIVDALMPDMDGFTLIESLQENEDAGQAPAILMVSSADRQTFRERAEDLEVAAYLEKPVSQSALLDAVMTALQGPPLEQAAVQNVQATHPRLRILVVEDTPANRKVVRTILEKRGHSVEVANNGREGIDRVTQERFDAVLMDVQMPTLDGLQATQAIRALPSEERRNVPIIAMTAHARREDRRKCLAAGMDAYIAKPIDAGELIRLVESVRRRPVEPVPDAQPAPEEDESASAVHGASVIDMTAAMARMNGDETLVAEMAQFFLDDAPQLLAEIDQALQSETTSVVQRAAHSLKGLAANFDAHAAVLAAARMEDRARNDELSDASAAFGELSREVQRTADALKQWLKDGAS